MVAQGGGSSGAREWRGILPGDEIWIEQLVRVLREGRGLAARRSELGARDSVHGGVVSVCWAAESLGEVLEPVLHNVRS